MEPTLELAAVRRQGQFEPNYWSRPVGDTLSGAMSPKSRPVLSGVVSVRGSWPRVIARAVGPNVVERLRDYLKHWRGLVEATGQGLSDEVIGGRACRSVGIFVARGGSCLSLVHQRSE